MEAYKFLEKLGYVENGENKLKSERKLKNLELPMEWKEFRFQLCLDKTEKEEIEVQVTLLHLIILHKDVAMLNIILKALNEKDLESGYFEEIIKVGDNAHDFLIEDDRWLFGANCLHLATKYLPEGLNLLLSNKVIKNVTKCLINTRTGPLQQSVFLRHVESEESHGCFCFCCHKEKDQNVKTELVVINSMAPLHIAARKADSVSTR
jgi:hypothetical protein